jgi:hypothetical protein
MDSDIVLKIGTWNVQYGRGAEKNATRLGLLLAHKADVWVLTETHSDLDLSPEYTSSTIARAGHTVGTAGVGIPDTPFGRPAAAR